MRIALVSYEYPPDTGFGGIGTYVHQAAGMLAIYMIGRQLVSNSMELYFP